MKSVNNLLPSADAALKNNQIEIVNGAGEVKEVFKGYISGFGPAIINSGLVSAMAFYLTDESKAKIIEAIAKTVNLKNGVYPLDNAEKLFKYCYGKIGDKIESNNLREKIINASIALKLMMRTYKFVK